MAQDIISTINDSLIQQNNFGCSYLIETNNPENILGALKKLLFKNISTADLIEISKIEDKQIIAIQQIREAKDFMFKTSIVSGRKALIINNAEDLNNNSATALLKLMEEPPKNSYIFIICQNKESLLKTIVSRCRIINDFSREQAIVSNAYISDFIKILNNQLDAMQTISFYRQIDKKKDNYWYLFSSYIIELYVKLSKYINNVDATISPEEYALFRKLLPLSQDEILYKYQKTLQIITNTNTLDLPLAASAICLIAEFKKKKP